MSLKNVTIADIAAPDRRAIAIGPFGSSLKADLYVPSGVPVVRGQNIKEGAELDETDLVFVDAETAARFPACLLNEGDLVFPHRGAIGRVGIAGKRQMLLSSSMMKLTVDPLKVDPRFLFYYFRGPGQRELLMRASTVGTPGIGQPLTSLRGIHIEIPELGQQRAIAALLGALDDKIAANARLVVTADSLSHNVFRSISGNNNTLLPLSSTAKFVNGKAFTKDASGTGRVVIRIAELNSGIGPSTVYNDIPADEQHLARAGDLLFAWSGSLTLHRWFRPEGIVNQHIFKVIPNQDFPHWLVYELLRHKLEEFKAIAADKATTMGHIQRKHLDEPVAVPAAASIREQNELMTALWEKALATEVENLKLAETRDALLLPLMAGNLRLKDAESVLETAGV